MKRLVQTLAKLIGSSFYIIEFLLIFFPFYYFFMLFLYFVVFLFDEGLISLIKWEENRYAKITTQTFDSFLHVYYYFFYFVSIFVCVIHIFMAGLGDYLVSKIYKDSEEQNFHDYDENLAGEKKETRNGKPDYVPRGRKRRALLNLIKFMIIVLVLFFINIQGNFAVRDYFPHTIGIELLFLVLAYAYSKTIYSNVYSYKQNQPQIKNKSDQELWIGMPMGYGIMKSAFWGYIFLFELVEPEIK